VCIWIGLLGQLSILASFCDAQAPLALTVARVGHGLWLGLAFGLLLTAGIFWRKRLAER
jgi:hypothetical protein